MEAFQPWCGEDLSSGAWDVSVVVWQWCRGVPERHGNLMALSEEWWCPYLAAENEAIEKGFKSDALHTEIRVLERTLAIRFTAGSSFALQRDERCAPHARMPPPGAHGRLVTALASRAHQ